MQNHASAKTLAERQRLARFLQPRPAAQHVMINRNRQAVERFEDYLEDEDLNGTTYDLPQKKDMDRWKMSTFTLAIKNELIATLFQRWLFDNGRRFDLTFLDEVKKFKKLRDRVRRRRVASTIYTQFVGPFPSHRVNVSAEASQAARYFRLSAMVPPRSFRKAEAEVKRDVQEAYSRFVGSPSFVRLHNLAI